MSLVLTRLEIVNIRFVVRVPEIMHFNRRYIFEQYERFKYLSYFIKSKITFGLTNELLYFQY